jgi:molecular chaperone GrpE
MNQEDETKQEREKEVQPESQPQNGGTPVANDLAAKLAEAEKQADLFKDLMYRKAAEFENYRKRAENDAASIVKFANESLIEELLPVLDDFERSLKSAKTSNDFESLYRGIGLIYQKLVKNLEKQGLKSFETVGKEFDVGFHDALLQMPRADVPPHTVIEEVEKGYTLNDKVIRHAKVVVSAALPEGPAATGGNGASPESRPDSENG